MARKKKVTSAKRYKVRAGLDNFELATDMSNP